MQLGTKIAVFVFVVVFLQFCSAQKVNCTSTSTPKGTRYSVPDFNASNCIYSWTDSSGHVFANHHGKNDTLVMSSSITEILTHKCYEDMKYKRSCTDERGTPEAFCNMTCPTEQDLLKEEGTSLSTTHIIVIVVGFVLVVFVVIAIVCFCIRWSMKKGYAAVKKANNQLGNERDVEQDL